MQSLIEYKLKRQGVCVGGPKDGQTLEWDSDQYDCIELTSPPTPDLANAPYMVPDDTVSYTTRGSYYYHGAAVTVFGQQIGVWAWHTFPGERHIADAIMAKLTAKTKTR